MKLVSFSFTLDVICCTDISYLRSTDVGLLRKYGFAVSQDMRFYLVLHTPLINCVLAQYVIQEITVSISSATAIVKM
jgi:hypothetical protein